MSSEEAPREVPVPPRVVIEDLAPAVDAGRFPTKAIAGEPLAITANVFCDGHDEVAAAVQVRRAGVSTWTEHPMQHVEQDRFGASVTFGAPGINELVVVGWVDRFASWLSGARRKATAGVLRPVDLAVGAAMVRDAGRRAPRDGSAAVAMQAWADRLEDGEFTFAAPAASGGLDAEPAVDAADPADAVRADDAARADAARVDEERLVGLVHRFADREPLAMTAAIEINVARPRAGFGAWYELFPRSWGPSGLHGTLADVERALPYVSGMGFDVLYLPPIHPIGTTHRKGRNNTTTAEPGDVGSPWAIGAESGGHTAVHPDLGTVDDLRRLVGAVADHGLEIALDLAFQCSPDHPWVREHPQWFRHLPDGSIQPAENPPKRYEDIYPLDFETTDWQALWIELEGVARFWIEQGVRIFRVDNPHTKPFAFWEWMIRSIRTDHPDVLFLSEALARDLPS